MESDKIPPNQQQKNKDKNQTSCTKELTKGLFYSPSSSSEVTFVIPVVDRRKINEENHHQRHHYYLFIVFFVFGSVHIFSCDMKS